MDVEEMFIPLPESIDGMAESFIHDPDFPIDSYEAFEKQDANKTREDNPDYRCRATLRASSVHSLKIHNHQPKSTIYATTRHKRIEG